MSERPQLMTQQQAARYITEHHEAMDQSTLSRLTKHGGGPPFSRLGRQKVFFQGDVDRWIEQDKNRKKEA